MKSTSVLVAAILTVTQACWWHTSAHAESKNQDKPEKAQKKSPPQKQKDKRKAQQEGRHNAMPAHPMPQHESLHAPSYAGAVPVGAYFREEQREAARIYYERPENRGFCPPGLAKKGNNCMPPGQAKKWRQGYPLPAGVVYYELPRSVVLSIGLPPSGYRYVRVASDILLVAIGTAIVVDALEDLVR